MYEGLDHLLLLKIRLQADLGTSLISENIIIIASRIGERVLKNQGRESFESIFEFLACYVLALKLSHGLIDDSESSIPQILHQSHSLNL